MDRIEALAMGRTPKDALRIGLRCSLSAFTAVDGVKPIAMLGVVPVGLLGGRGTVWMLGTDDLFRRGRDMLRLAPPVLAEWLETFSLLENVIAVENVKAIRVLKTWGFDVGGPEQVHRGVRFVPFRMGAIQAATQAA
jgi:hypothetical protein